MSELVETKQKTEAWHSYPSKEVEKMLDTSIEKGLTSEEANRRLKLYGENQLKEAPPPSIWKLLWDQFNDFTVMLLIAAAFISLIVSIIDGHVEWTETIVILAIVILNAIMGIIQERRAEQALSALKKLSAPDAQVLRDGVRQTIPSPQVVPGDVVFLEAGNYVPADIRLVETVNLRVEEAALTGESLPVEKHDHLTLEKDAGIGDRKNSAFMSTMINYGRGKGIIANTGMDTEIGHIATMLQSVEVEQTPLQRKLEQLGKTLGIGALVVCGLVFAIGVWRHDPAQPLGEAMIEMFMVAISLAVAAVPEGLPAVVTISLALGMQKMIDRHALIRKLSSVETLGSATTIGSDKTGTLTQNEMTVTRLWVDETFVDVNGTGYAPEGDFSIEGKPVEMKDHQGALTALWLGVLNNDSELIKKEVEGFTVYNIVGDPTEAAMVVAGAKADVGYLDLLKAYPREQEIPFDATRKRMTTIHRVHNPQSADISPFNEDDKDVYVVAVKGAPDMVLEHCTRYQAMDDTQKKMTDQMRTTILDANKKMANDALRVLAVAFKIVKEIPEDISVDTMESDLIFVGLQGMIDPPREEVKQALLHAKGAGVRTVMITGDYPATARAIAKSIGLYRDGTDVITGHQLEEMSDEELVSVIDDVDVFARVSPEHKVRIVQALRAHGDVIAMTGDGVNDAPALKQADIGVAMGITGTDVAKGAADMVLTDDNYSSIVSAIEQGRIIYSNIRKFVYYLLSCNMAEIMIIFLAIVIGWASPLSAIQLLWLNLITDGAPALALGMEEGDPDIMDQPPRPSSEPIINKRMTIGVVVQTVAITSVTLGAYWWGHHIENVAAGDFNMLASTMAFVTLSFSELFRAYTARSERYSVFKIGFFSNKTMNWAVLFSLALLVGVVYLPFANTLFGTQPLSLQHWYVVAPLILVPSIAAEVTKAVVRKMKLG